jgi:putative membrane protein
MKSLSESTLHLCLLAALALVFVWSLVDCYDLLTWGLESFPVIIAVAILIPLYSRFRMTNLACILIFLHAVILLVGAHYSYARMPLFDWLRDTFELSRNHYDRLGHFAQGFIPAVIAREVLLRKSPLGPGRWLFFIVISICLAVSAAYELIEWLAALVCGTGATAFLGTQGDPWDTQNDMALCLVGAVVSLISLGRVHDSQLRTFLPGKD